MAEMVEAPELAFKDLGCTAREEDLFAQAVTELEKLGEAGPFELGRIVSLDRSLPLVLTRSGSYRAEHDVRMAKTDALLPAIGDWVCVSNPPDHEHPVIEAVLPRTRLFSRRDPRDHDKRQVLAANIDVVLVVHPLSSSHFDAHRLERELVCAWESGAVPSLILTKADTAAPEHLAEMLDVAQVVAPGAAVVVESAVTGEGVEEVRELVPPGATAVVIGRSGAGKSTLINRLFGATVAKEGEVNDQSGFGRHTTVGRSLIKIPGGGVIIDAPGIRTIALADAWSGLSAAFPEITALEGGCRFRDCKHVSEPGCVVLEAVERGEVDERRLASYRVLRDEMDELEAKLVRSGRGTAPPNRKPLARKKRKR